MSKEEKLQEILDSHTNGQNHQMVEKIRDYGITYFVLDFDDFLSNWGHVAPESYLQTFRNVLYTFFMLK